MVAGERRPRVVIAGGGFGGIWALRGLSGAPVDVVLVDRENYHTFLPLLYQVAAGEIEPEAIAYPIRSLLRGRPQARFVMAGIRAVDPVGRRLITDGPTIPYDYLVLALGSAPHYFGVAGAAAHAFALRTLDQGVALRNQILRCFERAAHEPDAGRREQLLTFITVGGGPTGVEFAGALAELVHGPLRKDYPGLDLRQEVRLVLLEATDALLPGLPPPLRRYTLARLQRMGVQVRLGTAVAAVRPDGAVLADGTHVASATVVWTAGVRGAPRVAEWGLPTARNGCVPVTPSLQLAGHPEIYVVGDLAHLPAAGQPLPMVAPVATQQGALAARNIRRQLAGRPGLPFRYRDRGTMVTIGRNAAVARVYGRSFKGFPAWLLWVGVHLLHLIGFRNRLLVMINWAWDYWFFERTVRLILPSAPPAAPGSPAPGPTPE